MMEELYNVRNKREGIVESCLLCYTERQTTVTHSDRGDYGRKIAWKAFWNGKRGCCSIYRIICEMMF